MRVFAYKKLKAILDLETIVCLMRTLYGEIEIHATQCQNVTPVMDEQTNGGKWIIVQYSVRPETAIENH